MAAAIQFWGIDAVMSAFDSRQVDAWSLWQGRDYLFKGLGDADLRTVLETLKNSYNDPIYTLKVYEEINDPVKIKDKTPHDGCFNFKLNQPLQVEGMGYVSPNSNYQLAKKVEELERKLLEKNTEDFDEEEEENETIGKVITDEVIGVIRDPNRLLQWMEIIKGIFNPNNQSAQQKTLPPVAIGNVMNTPITEEEKEKQADRLLIAIDALEKADPKIVDHLEKLASIATKNPGQFKFLLSMLDTMK